MVAIAGWQKQCLDKALRALCVSASRREPCSLTSEAMRIEGKCGQAGFAAAREQMIATLDSFRDTLEDLGEGRGVTDPVSGPVVLEMK